MTTRVAALCVGGPLDGQRVSVDEWDGCYWHGHGNEVHVYHRRYGYVVVKEKVLSRSPQVYEHQPALTREVRR